MIATYLRAVFQPGIAWPHLASLLVLVVSFLAAQIFRLKIATTLWLIVASSSAVAFLSVPLVGGFRAGPIMGDIPHDLQPIIPDWLFYRYDQPTAFWAYLWTFVALLIIRALWKPTSTIGVRTVALATVGLLVFNGFFVALPFVLSKPLKLVIKSADMHPLAGASFRCHSYLTGEDLDLRSNSDGNLFVRMLWRDVIEGQIRARGYSTDHFYVSRKERSAGAIFISHQFPLDAEHPRSRDIVCISNLAQTIPVYLPIAGQLQPLPYEDVYLIGDHRLIHHPERDYSLPR